MKNLLLLLLLFPVLLQGQTKTTYDVTFDGVQRKFIEFIPSGYDGSTPLPVVIALHGLGDNAENFSNVVGFEQLAEQNDFIVITPEALVAVVFSIPVGTAWNSGAEYLGITLNSDVKDVEFISFLIDSVSAHFNVDLTRVYATGFSMGGFMSNRLACELNSKIAAIGTVAGTIGGAIDCMPGRAVPELHFHGTADGTVPYTNNNYGTDAEETVEFWASNAGCSATPDSSDVPDTKNDGITLKHYTYNNCDADVEFYKAIGAGHTWLNSVQNDISYTQTIWEFFTRQSNSSVEECSSLSVDLGGDQQVIIGETVVLDATTADATYSWQDGNDQPTYSVTTGGIYWVDVTVGNCTVRDSVRVDFVTGLVSHSNSFEFSVYPNPMTDRGMISIHSLTDKSLMQVEVLDVTGRTIMVNEVELAVGDNLIPLELDNVARGTYILSLKVNGEQSSQPFIVK
ncbi:MAG: PHB depolymerase family esterase [Chitinophagales bacterium]